MCHPQAESSSSMVAVFDFERSLGTTFLGLIHHPILTKIPTPSLVFPYMGQAPVPLMDRSHPGPPDYGKHAESVIEVA